MQRTGIPHMTRRDFLRASLVAALGASGLLAASCAPSAPPAPTAAAAASKAEPTAAAPKTLKPVKVSTTATAAGLLSEIIRRQKLDEQVGLKAEFQTFTPAEAERAVALRQVDCGLMVPQSLAQSNLEGIPLRAFMSQFSNHISIVVREDAPYKDLEDLKGKKIGTLAKITSGYQSMAMIARLKKMDWEKDFQLVVGEAPVLMSWLVKGDVDATMVFEPNTAKFLAAEKVRVLKDQQAWWSELASGTLLTGLVAGHKEWVDKNPDVVKGLQQAYTRAIEFVAARPSDMSAIYKDFFKVDDERALARLNQRMAEFYRLQWDNKTIEDTRNVIKLAVELKILPEMPKDDLFMPLL